MTSRMSQTGSRAETEQSKAKAMQKLSNRAIPSAQYLFSSQRTKNVWNLLLMLYLNCCCRVWTNLSYFLTTFHCTMVTVLYPAPFVQVLQQQQQTWSVVAASSPTAAAAATGAGTMVTWAPLPRRPSQRWTAAPTKACTWNSSTEASTVPKSQRYVASYCLVKVFYWWGWSCILLTPHLQSQLSYLSQSSFRSVYKCLWPSCGKVLTSSVGMKRHIRVLHLG